MKQKLLLIVSVCLFSVSGINAQTVTKITGQIKDNSGKPLTSATIMLHSVKDSSLAKTAVSDSKGNYEIASHQSRQVFHTHQRSKHAENKLGCI